MEIKFLVQGSDVEPYTVIFRNSEEGLVSLCNCLAGKNGMYCKHRIRILRGSIEGIISENLNDVDTVKSWFPGSRVEHAIIELELAENQLESFKKKISQLKRNVAKCLLNQKS